MGEIRKLKSHIWHKKAARYGKIKEKKGENGNYGGKLEEKKIRKRM